jgi:hypothetical protein
VKRIGKSSRVKDVLFCSILKLLCRNVRLFFFFWFTCLLAVWKCFNLVKFKLDLKFNTKASSAIDYIMQYNFVNCIWCIDSIQIILSFLLCIAFKDQTYLVMFCIILVFFLWFLLLLFILVQVPIKYQLSLYFLSQIF